MTTQVDSQRELPHPLVFVAAEVRFPFTPRLTHEDSAIRVQDALPELPILNRESVNRMVASEQVLNLTPETSWRFIDRAHTTSLVMTPTSVVYETTRYPGFELFLSNFRKALQVIESVVQPVGIERVGIRYVNEVRAPEPIRRAQDWSKWINVDVLAPALGAENAASQGARRSEVTGWSQALSLAMPHDHAMTLQMAALDGPGVVGNQPLLRWENPPPGPFFAVDIDSFWPNGTTVIDAFTVEDVCTHLDSQHQPVKDLFNWIVSPQLLNRALVNYPAATDIDLGE